MKHYVSQLIEYHLWANQRVFSHLKELPREMLHKEIPSVFSTICDVLSHIYVVDMIWLRAMSGDSFEEIRASVQQYVEESKGKSVEELENLISRSAEKYQVFLSRLQDPDAPVTIHHPRYGKLTARYSDLLQHVVNHGTYHRGNITAMLWQLGHSGIPTDYVFFLYEEQK